MNVKNVARGNVYNGIGTREGTIHNKCRRDFLNVENLLKKTLCLESLDTFNFPPTFPYMQILKLLRSFNLIRKLNNSQNELSDFSTVRLSCLKSFNLPE